MAVQAFDPTLSSQRSRRNQALPSSKGRPPVRWVPRLSATIAAIGLLLAIGAAVTSETGSLLSVPGGIATFIGSLTGMAGMYLALVMVLLVSRIPIIERALGQDGLLRWHRRVAPWPISLLVAHALFVIVGYAQAAKTGFLHETSVLVLRFPNILAATVGLGLMVFVGVVSIRAVRNRLQRETWWVIHLYMYLALSLSFAHVILLGPSFVGHPFNRIAWSVLWAATAGLVIGYRVVTPLARSLRYGLRIKEIRREGPDVVSVVCYGRHLERLSVSGGQFFAWRFLARGLWWQAHPYSLSARPRPPYLRLTVKQVGDHSKAVARLRPGTRVFVEGPFGAFTAHAIRQGKVLLIAGGIGVTALRALLEDLPRGSNPVVIVRASSEENLVLRNELAELVRHRKGKLHELIGPRSEVVLHEGLFRELVPDIARRDAFVCGPPEFVQTVVAAVEEAGVPKKAIHFEEFGW